MAEHIQEVGFSQESGEVNLHDDWTSLTPSINEMLKDDHLKAAIESLHTDVNAVPVDLPKNPKNYFELEDQTNSLWTVSDVVDRNPVPVCRIISSIREDSNIDQDSDTELNLSYEALDCQEDAEIPTTAAYLANCDRNSQNIAFQTKDQEVEANLLQINGKESFPIDYSECNEAQLKELSNTLSQNSFAEMLNTDEANDRQLSCSAGKSKFIQEEIKSVDESSVETTGEKHNIVVTKSNATEVPTHSEASVKYKPQFGNKKRKLNLSEATDKVETATKSILATETCSIQVASAEDDSTTIVDETAVSDDNIANLSPTETIRVEIAEAETSDKGSKHSSATNEPKSITSENETLPTNKKTAKCNKNTIRGKPSTCASGTISEAVLAESKNSKLTSEPVSRKGKKSTLPESKLGKGKARASSKNQNSAVVPNLSHDKEQKITDIKYFLEQQESLATARNLLRCEKQKNEFRRTEKSATKTVYEETLEDAMQDTYEEKVRTLDDEVSLLETLIDQVKSLTEGEEDNDKCLSLLGNIREKVSASLLLKYPVTVAILEPMQRYEIDERIKQEAKNIYRQFDSMYIKQNMEDFVFNFDRTLKFHQRCLAKSERLAQKILKRILPDRETDTESTFYTEMWSNLAKERDSVWDRYIQEFRESDKTTMFQAASGSSSQTLDIKDEVQEVSNDFNTLTHEQQGTEKLPQTSCDRSSRKASHSSLKSNPNQAETIVKPECGEHNDADVKPVCNKRLIRIKKEIVLNTETQKPNTDMQRRQPTRSCKLQNIKREVFSDEPIVTDEQETDRDTEILDIKKEMQQKQIRKSSNIIKIKEEVISGHEQIVRIKKEIDPDAYIPNTSRDFMRIQPRRSCKPNEGKLELRMHFTNRKRYFNREMDQKSKKARVSSE